MSEKKTISSDGTLSENEFNIRLNIPPEIIKFSQFLGESLNYGNLHLFDLLEKLKEDEKQETQANH